MRKKNIMGWKETYKSTQFFDISIFTDTPNFSKNDLKKKNSEY